MEQAALAFLPGTADRHEYKELVKLLLGVGVVVGAVTAFVATAVPYYLPFLFTPDAQLWPIMKSIAPQVWGSSSQTSYSIVHTGLLVIPELVIPELEKPLCG